MLQNIRVTRLREEYKHDLLIQSCVSHTFVLEPCCEFQHELSFFFFFSFSGGKHVMVMVTVQSQPRVCLGLFSRSQTNTLWYSWDVRLLFSSQAKISQEQQLKQLEALSQNWESKINTTVGREGSRTHTMEAKFYKTWKNLHGHANHTWSRALKSFSCWPKPAHASSRCHLNYIGRIYGS